MSKTQHTPGPWQAKPAISRWNVTTTNTTRTFNICTLNTDRFEQEENARLIAAAPELLWFCEQVLNSSAVRIESDEDETLANVLAKGFAAINKARGQS